VGAIPEWTSDRRLQPAQIVRDMQFGDHAQSRVALALPGGAFATGIFARVAAAPDISAYTDGMREMPKRAAQDTANAASLCETSGPDRWPCADASAPANGGKWQIRAAFKAREASFRAGIDENRVRFRT